LRRKKVEELRETMGKRVNDRNPKTFTCESWQHELAKARKKFKRLSNGRCLSQELIEERAGIDALNRKLGPLETERFITNLLKDPADYTSWRKNLWSERTISDISTTAMAVRKKASNHSKAISLTGRIKDPTGIAGSWSDSRSAEEIIANIHDSRKSKR
jgi:hypothetical protein